MKENGGATLFRGVRRRANEEILGECAATDDFEEHFQQVSQDRFEGSGEDREGGERSVRPKRDGEGERSGSTVE